MRRRWKAIPAAASAAALAGWFGIPAAPASAEEATWSSAGCAPVEEGGTGWPEFGAAAHGGLEGAVDFYLPRLTYTPAVPDGLPEPLPMADPVTGTAVLTIEVLPDRRNEDPWTGMEDLGFDTSAMDEPAPEPIDVEVSVPALQQVHPPATPAGSINPNTASLAAESWDPAYAAYGVVAAEISFPRSDDDPWCVLEFSAPAEDPLAEFAVLPSDEEMDEALGEVAESAEDEAGSPWEPAADGSVSITMAATVAAALTVLVGGLVLAGILLDRRRRPSAPPPGEPGEE